FGSFQKVSASFVTASATVHEDDGVVTINAETASPLPFDTSVPVTFSGSAVPGQDYVVSDANLFFPAGSTTGTLTLIIVDDSRYELSDTIVLTIGSGGGITAGTTSSHSLSITDNDSVPEVSFLTASNVVQEDVGTVSVEVRMTAESDQDTTIPLLFSGTAADPDDYVLSGPAEIVIPAGSLRGSTTLSIVDDADSELAERIVVDFGAITGAAVSTQPGDPGTHVIIIPQNDAPNVSFTASHGSLAENGGQLVVTARLSHTSSTNVDIPLTVSHGINVTTSDYAISPSAFISIPIGQLEGSVTLTGSNDNIDENSERVTFRMGAVTGAVPGAVQTFVASILDDDRAFVEFVSAGTTVWEGDGPRTVGIRLTNPTTSPVSIRLEQSGTAQHAGDSRDYDLNQTVIFFGPGESGIKFVTVDPREDSANEKTEFGYLGFSSVTGATVNTRKRSHRLTIKDNDPYVYMSEGADIRERGETSTTITLKLTAPTNRTVTVPLVYGGSAVRNKDFTAPTSVTITPADGTTKTFTIKAKNDSFDEYTETVSVRIKNPTNALTTSSRKTSDTISITDNDALPEVNFTSRSQTANEGTRVTVSVALLTISEKTVTVPVKISKYSTASTNDHNFTTKILKFGPRQTRKSFTIDITDDTKGESQEELRLYISSSLENATRQSGSRTYHSIFIRANDRTIRTSSGEAKLVKTSQAKKQTANSKQAVTGSDQLLASDDITDKDIGTIDNSAFSGVDLTKFGTANVSDNNQPLTLAVDSGGVAGYVVAGTGFFDANFNGIVDFLDLNANGVQDDGEPSEPVTTTRQDGSFSLEIGAAFDVDGNETLDLHEGRFVLTGGLDGATQVPFTGQFSSVPGQLLLSSISSTIQHLTQFGFDTPAASTRIQQALNLPEGLALETLDLYEATIDGNVDAAIAYARSAELFNATVVAAQLFNRSLGAPPVNVLVDQAYGEIASRIQVDGSQIDLSDSASVLSFLEGISFRTGIILSPEELGTGAEMIARGNAIIRDLPITTDAAFVEQIVRVEAWMQGVLALHLRDANDIAEVQDAYSAVGSIETAVANTAIGDIEVPVIFVNDVVATEGDNGTTNYDFTVTLTTPSKFGVAVAFETTDDSAVADSGDYNSVSGTLEWAPGESGDRTVSVTVNGDQTAEAEERFYVTLFDALNAIVRRDQGSGFLLNDDTVDYTATHEVDQNENLFFLELSADDVMLLEDDEEVFAGFQFDPWIASLRGEDDFDDTLFLDFSAGTYRGDTITFHGGGGTGFDTAVINGGEFDSITQSLANATDGQTVFDPVDSDAIVTFNWTGLEPFLLNVGSVNDLVFELPAGLTSAVLEDADPTDTINPGMMQLRSPDGHFETTIFPVPTGSLTIRGGDGADTITIGDLDPTFLGIIRVQTTVLGDDPVTVDHAGFIDAGTVVVDGIKYTEFTKGTTPDVVTLQIQDTSIPTVVDTSFTATGILAAGSTSLEVRFSESVLGADIASNFQLHRAGPDGLLGSADDIPISVNTASYGNTSLTSTLTFVSLVEDVYRLTVSGTITDIAGTALDGDSNGSAGGNFVRDFVVNGSKAVGLDTTFGGDGIVTTSSTDSAYSIAAQPDGKLIVAGVIANDFGLVRYNGDGTLDATFGNNGAVSTQFGPSNDTARGVSLQTDGKIIVVGYILNAASKTEMAIARYNPDGTLDPSFNGDGKLTIAIGTEHDYAIDVVVQADGTIVVAGATQTNSGTFDIAVIRLNNDGSFDTSFSDDGKVTTNIFSSHDFGYSVALQTDGKIVVAGETYAGIWSFAVVRLNTDGSLDTSFSEDGKVSTRIDDQSFGRSVAVQSDGMIVVAGRSQTGGFTDFALARYSADGTLDTSFDHDGIVTTVFGANNDDANDVIVQSDGKIVVAGYSNNGNKNDFALARYNVDGSLDSSFDGDGKLTVAIGVNSDLAQSVAVQGDRKIVIAGHSNNDFAVIRLSEDPNATNLISAGGSMFDVDGVGHGTGQLLQGPNDAFDGLNRLQVNGVDFATADSGVSEDAGQTVVIAQQMLSGLEVSREITVPTTGPQDFARTIEGLTNPTGSDISATIRIVGNLGSDGDTEVFKTSSGDATVEVTDQWIGTDDADGTGSPAIIHHIHGPSGLVPSSVDVVGDNIVWEFDVTVPAGETIRLATFTILGDTRAEAEAAAATLVSTSGFGGEAAAFLTQAELDSLANFSFNTAPTAVDDVNGEVSLSEDDSTTDITASILANDSDPDAGDSVSVTEVSANGSTVTTSAPGSITLANGAILSLDASGNISFNPNGQFESLAALSTDATSTFSYTIADHSGVTDTADVVITIIGANDAASISGTAARSTDEDSVSAVTGVLGVTDVDDGEDVFVAQTGTTGTYGTFDIDANGNWTYTLNNSSVQNLNAGDVVSDSFSVASVDGTASELVVVTINGLNDAATISGTAVGSTDEDTASSVTGALNVSDI
ncbi:MAG: VCBS domain-containing protein, partial [Planctomycetaceae bacterium]|nr:VCBS domain-containing protein [Planctomycetaceae bacterium]